MAKSESDKAIELMANLYSELSLLNKNLLCLNEGIITLVQRLDEQSTVGDTEEDEVEEENTFVEALDDVKSLLASLASLKKRMGK